MEVRFEFNLSKLSADVCDDIGSALGKLFLSALKHPGAYVDDQCWKNGWFIKKTIFNTVQRFEGEPGEDVIEVEETEVSSEPFSVGDVILDFLSGTNVRRHNQWTYRRDLSALDKLTIRFWVTKSSLRVRVDGSQVNIRIKGTRCSIADNWGWMFKGLPDPEVSETSTGFIPWYMTTRDYIQSLWHEMLEQQGVEEGDPRWKWITSIKYSPAERLDPLYKQVKEMLKPGAVGASAEAIRAVVSRYYAESQIPA